jgi:flagellar biosynthetic protein FliO
MSGRDWARGGRRLPAALCIAVVGAWLMSAGEITRAQEPRRAADRIAESAETAEEAPAAMRALTPRGARSTRPSGRTESATTGGAWWSTMGGLAIVLCVVGGLAWLARKHLPTAARGLPGAAFEVLGRRTIEPRAAVHLVRCGNRILLLGSTPAGLTALTEFSDPEEVDHIAGICRAGDDAQMSFLQMFRRAEAEPVKEFSVRGPEALAEEEAPTPVEEIAVERVRRSLGQGL